VTEEPTLAYLAEVLALDPAEQSGRIVELRARRVTGAGGSAPRTDPARASVSARSDARDAARAVIESGRDGFWSQDAEELDARLAALALDEFPDLARARARLLQVNDLRGEADALTQNPDADRTLTAILRRVLVAPGPEAARLRDQAARDSALTHRASRARAFTRLLRREYPGLADLESDWLARLVRARKDKKDSAAIKGGIGCLGIYLVVSLGTRLIKLIIEWFQGS